MAMIRQEVDVDDDEVLEVDEAGGVWPKPMESFFICLMEEEVKKGNRQTTTFSKNAWKTIKEELKKNLKKTIHITN